MYLTKSEILKLIDSDELIIRPLLDRAEQVGELSVDFRLGTDFLLSFQGRNSAIDASKNDHNSDPSSSFFQETRRLVGDSFLFHPLQTVLCSTLEYIKLPDDIFLSLTIRSSYSRLGLSVSAIVEPGYCGCISMELTNVNNNPVKITVGSRLVQARFYRVTEKTNYFEKIDRKYICQVRPEVSFANGDKDRETLLKIKGKVI
ncbi:MAG: dCTP deaminase [Bacteroidetes bacterium]|nr:dCTP deaminase [Bacteroidota bacterium]